MSRLQYIFFFLVFLLLSCSVSTFVYATTDEVISTDAIWEGNKIVDGHVAVPSGVTLTVKKGSILSFKNNSFIEVSGTLDIRGTVMDPVILRSAENGDTYSIRGVDSGKITIRNADISGGGKVIEYETDPNTGITPFPDFFGAITASGASLVSIGSTSFHNNIVAVYANLSNIFEGGISVNRSKFFDNEKYDVVNNNPQRRYNFQYNWWGSEDGPNFNKLFKEIDTEFFVTKKEFHDPVIFIPGILGSLEVGDKWRIDPVFHVYDNLIETLIKNGYKENEDLYVFPYDWRKSNILTAQDLRQKIEQIKNKHNWPKVDIVAHSMGGLLSRQYIESDQFGDDVDQLITLGTPHNGAPVAYLRWERGDPAFSVQDMFANTVFRLWANHEGYDDVFDYIRNFPIESLKELLPVYSYIYENETERIYPDNYPRNEFLENLNKKDLNQIEFTNIIGNQNIVNTISAFNVIRNSNGKYWEHGYPIGFDSTDERINGLRFTAGDATVPLESAKNILSDEEIEINSSHLELPSNSAKTVYKALTGGDSIANSAPFIIKSILVVPVFSPVDIQIISPSGKRVGKNFETGKEHSEIPGAFYTGYNTKNEFITIPNPEEGKYEIFTQGVEGGGEYRVEAIRISEGERSGDVTSESKVVFTGNAKNGSVEEKKIEIREGEVKSIEENDTILPVIKITSPENKEYLNNILIPLVFSVTDNISSKDSIITTVKLDGKELVENNIDLSLNKLGEHVITIIATDEAGNTTEQSVVFQSKTTTQSLIINTAHYFEIKLIKKKGDALRVQASLKSLEVLQIALERAENSFLQKKLKDIFIKKIKKQIEHAKQDLIEFIQLKESKGMLAAQASERLIEGINVLFAN